MTRTAPTFDERRPFVLDTRALGRRPGEMWEGHRSLPAPAGLGRDLVWVPEGAALELDLRLETVLDGVLVTASVSAALTGECARCLEEVTDTLSVALTELYSYPEQAVRYQRTAVVAEGQDDGIGHLDGDRLDLEQVLRDAIVLALPASPLCRADCAGLCVDCGVRLDDAEPGHTHDEQDPRWAGLRGLVERD